jgi:hypothetical protein
LTPSNESIVSSFGIVAERINGLPTGSVLGGRT